VSPARTVVLDNEAVQALIDPAHRKHRRVCAVVEAVAARNQRRAGTVRLVVPTAVRVEAGWDKRASKSTPVNRLRTDDMPLDSATADRGAAIRAVLAVSIADAHVGAVLESTEGPHAVITSDVKDMERIAAHIGVSVAVVRV